MTDLPVLRIGCKKRCRLASLKLVYDTCGNGNFLCYECLVIKNKIVSVVLAHAATYQEKMREHKRNFPNDVHDWTKCFQCGDWTKCFQCGNWEAARDAVLKLAGTKDLEDLK